MSIKNLTRLGSDTKKIAALLQAKAPKGHVLAYISPKEASILKARGGSGHPHGDTGVLSFENELDTSFGGMDIQGGQDFAPPTTTPDFSYEAFMPQTSMGPAPVSPEAFSGESAALSSFPQAREAVATPSADLQARGQQALEEMRDQAAAPAPKAPEGMKDETLKRLGLAGALGILGTRTAGKAAATGQAGAQQMQTMAAPYQKAGADVQAAASRGELTPSGQQSLQAMRAQAQQAVAGRGGVGAIQAEQAVEAFRQQLLQQQYDYGLKLSGIGDNIALGAIKTGLQADQYVNQLTNQFYTNMAYVASGMSPGIRI